MTEGMAEDLDTMRKILGSAEWRRLHQRLMEYVNNYEQKVIRVTNGGFPL
jgi:hypothetical protein